MVVLGVDYSYARPLPTELYKAGYRFVIRYLYGSKAGKAVTRTEVDALHQAGLSVVLNWEWQADEASGGYTAGVDRAKRAVSALGELEAPDGSVVYFSVDSDAVTTTAAREYFRGVRAVIPHSRVGVYGGRRIVAAAKTEAWCSWFWQTYAWSGGVWVPGCHLQQFKNGYDFQGSDVDLDRALVTRYGQWAAPVKPVTKRKVPTMMLGKVRGPHGTEADTVYRSDGLMCVPMFKWSAVEELLAVGVPMAEFDTKAELEDALGQVAAQGLNP